MKLSRFLALSAATLLGTAATHAQVVTPNPAPTIITTAPYTITAPGFYQLGADLTVSNVNGAIITINASNVTLDFAGHYISGPSDAGAIADGQLYGVLATEQGNITIQNGTIAFCYVGIDFAGDGSSTSIAVNEKVQNMLVTYCSHFGLYLNNANFSRLLNNVISNIQGTMVYGVDGNYGIFMIGQGNEASYNSIIKVTAPSILSATKAYGIFQPSTSTGLAIGNKIFNVYNGINGVSKYLDNLTVSVTTPFTGGMSATGNN